MSRAVDDRQERSSQRKLQSSDSSTFLDVERRKREFSHQALLSTAVGPGEMPNPALREHTYFTTEPHPLIIAKNDRCLRTGGIQYPNNISANTNHNQLYNRESLLGVLDSGNVGVVDSDEDPEYYSELEDTVNRRKKHHLPTSVSSINLLEGYCNQSVVVSVKKSLLKFSPKQSFTHYQDCSPHTPM